MTAIASWDDLAEHLRERRLPFDVAYTGGGCDYLHVPTEGGWMWLGTWENDDPGDFPTLHASRWQPGHWVHGCAYRFDCTRPHQHAPDDPELPGAEQYVTLEPEQIGADGDVAAAIRRLYAQAAGRTDWEDQ